MCHIFHKDLVLASAVCEREKILPDISSEIVENVQEKLT